MPTVSVTPSLKIALTHLLVGPDGAYGSAEGRPLVIFTLMSGARNGRFCGFLTTENDVVTEKMI